MGWDDLDPVLSPSRMAELRSIREREADGNVGTGVDPALVHLRPGEPCAHCGDPSFCRGRDSEPCCQDCWLELSGGLIPPACEITDNCPHKPKNVSIRSLMRAPGMSEERDREEYFGNHMADTTE